MSNQMIFVLPIYLRSRDKYYEEHDQYMEEQWKNLAQGYEGDVEKARERFADDWTLLDNWRWPPWEFNDIIGYISINVVSSSFHDGMFKAYVSELNRKRINRDPRHRRGVICFRGWKVGESWMWTWRRFLPNENLRQGLLALLLQIQEKMAKSGWYIDQQSFIDMIASVDWCGFLTRKNIPLHSSEPHGCCQYSLSDYVWNDD